MEEIQVRMEESYMVIQNARAISFFFRVNQKSILLFIIDLKAIQVF